MSSFPQRAGAARDEIGDAVLRMDALVEVLVTGQHDVDVAVDEDGFQRRVAGRARRRCSARTCRADDGNNRSSSRFPTARARRGATPAVTGSNDRLSSTKNRTPAPVETLAGVARSAGTCSSGGLPC